MNKGIVKSSINTIINMITKAEKEGLIYVISECERLNLPYSSIEIFECPYKNHTRVKILGQPCFEYIINWPYPEHKGSASLRVWEWNIKDLWDCEGKLKKERSKKLYGIKRNNILYNISNI